MYADIFHPIALPRNQAPGSATFTDVLPGTDQDKVEVYRGVKRVEGISVEADGSGAYAEGHIEGDVTTHDWRALYRIYNLEDHEKADYWFVHYRKDTRHDELKKVFEQSQTQTFHYSMNYRLHGNDFGITQVVAGFTTIRLDYQGETKMFTVTNNSSLVAKTPEGRDYPGGFETV